MNIRERLALAWRVLRYQPDNLLAHAERELPPADGDEMQEAMNLALREIVFVFGSQGHSGFSAGYATSALEKLLRFEPLRPLTGEPDEWTEIDPGYWQNNRCSRVFKDTDGRAYDTEGRVFCEPDGGCYTGIDSRVYITFPYRPKTEYVDVPFPSERSPS